MPLFLKIVIAALLAPAACHFAAHLRPTPAYLRQFRAMPAGPPGSPAARGRHPFRTVGAMNRHTVGGYGGTLGPNLTHIASSGLTPQFLGQWPKDPAKVMPSATMPGLPLAHRQVDDLTSYLESLK